MKGYRHLIFYLVNLAVFAVLMYFLIESGKTIEVQTNPAPETTPESSAWEMVKETIHHNLTHPLAILLLQIITIVFTARTFGFIFNKIGQPTVIGEILAGIFLGPSLMGMWFPGYSDFLFPKESIGNLQFLSQVGLVLFMFVIGMELDLNTLKTKARDAIFISHTSIIISFLLGMGLAKFLYDEFAPESINFTSFSLFMGSATSITAFPVLARILQERDLTKTKLGTLALTCAAADDLTAWCILAAVIAIVKAGSIMSALFIIAMALVYVFLMLKLVQPFVKKLGEVYSNRESLSLNIVAAVFGILLISSLATEVIGIHALFGAFLAGVIMPSSIGFRRILTEKVESVSVGLLLPLFFVLTGLRTQIGLLNEPHLWMVGGVIIIVAITGKFGGGLFAAKVSGQNWKDSLSLGALMNTRGLMELVVLNIGYDLGILKPEIFAMMVLMALATTFMTGPLLNLINWAYKKNEDEVVVKLKQKFRILLSFANPQSGKKLARIAGLLVGQTKRGTEITALHVTPTADINKYQVSEYEKESFRPIKSEAGKLGLEIKTNYKVSNDVSAEILSEANSGEYDIMLVGVGQSVFAGSLLGQFIGITASALNPDKLIGALTGKNPLFKAKSIIDEKSVAFINNSKIPVGVFIDHEMEQVEKVIIPVLSVTDVFLLFYAKKMVKNSKVTIGILDYNGIISVNTEIKEEISSIESFAPNRVTLLDRKVFKNSEFGNYDLVILSMEGYNGLANDLDLQEEEFSSMLLVRP